jgi:hypothetical protein
MTMHLVIYLEFFQAKEAGVTSRRGNDPVLFDLARHKFEKTFLSDLLAEKIFIH